MTARLPQRSPSLLPVSARVGRWLFAIAIAGSALAVGSVHTVVLCIITGILAIAACITWWRAEPIYVRRVATLLLWLGTALTLYTAFQCMPLPVSLLGKFAPYNADVWSRALDPLRAAGPRWAPISLDPIATHIEVLKGVAYLLAFLTALRVARSREGIAFLSLMMIATGVALAVAALLHPAFGARKLYGLYEPGPGIDERHLAPLMNPNNLAGYLNIAFCLALAAVLSQQPRVPRPIMAAVVLLLGATQLWVASRSGVVAMGLGGVVVVAITRFANRRRRRVAVASLSIASGAAAAVGAAMVALGGSEQASNELFVSDVSKLQMFDHVMRMLPAVKWVGCGRGAFETVYPAFRDFGAGYVMFTHPENVVAQWTLEWGAIVGGLGLVTIAFALRPTAVLARSTSAAGAWAAVVAMAVQNLGDLGTEIPGLMLACVVCGAIVVAGSPGREPRSAVERWSARPSYVAVLALIAAVAAIAMGTRAIGVSVSDDRRAMHAEAMNVASSAAATHARVCAAILRHPAEPYLPFAVALRAQTFRDDASLPWLEATLARAEMYGPAHLLLARALWRKAPAQARLEYRLFSQQSPELAWVGLKESPGLVGGFDDAMELVPDGAAGVVVLDRLAASLAERLPATRVRLDQELLARAPATSAALARMARDAVQDVEARAGAPWCDEPPARAACVREAEGLIERERTAAPDRCDAYMLEARLHIASSDPGRALDDLGRAVELVKDRVPCLKEFIGLADRAGDLARAEAALDEIVNAGCAEDGECVQNLIWAAERQEGRGNAPKALALYRRAADLAPDNDAILEACARLAAQIGLHAEAAEDYDRLARKHPDDLRWAKAADAEKLEALRSPTPL